MIRSSLYCLALLLWPSVGFAQSYSPQDYGPQYYGPQNYGLSAPSQIETETLGQAQDFEAGILTDSALDAQLWQGTSALRASRLLSIAPLRSDNPIIEDMVRTVILSGGVPPRARNSDSEKAYENARLSAVMSIGDGDILDGFLARNPELARSPLAQVDLAFAKGDSNRACEISDTITEDRGAAPWVRLRATCHALRGEMAAAELTRDLLRSSGYDDPAFFAQLSALVAGTDAPQITGSQDALIEFLASREAVPTDQLLGAPLTSNDDSVTPPTREGDLKTLFEQFNTLDLGSLASTLGNISFDINQPDLDLETALSDPSARATARLFVLGQAGEAQALDAFISRAIRRGVSEDDLLLKFDTLIRALPAQARAETNLKRFTRAAVLSSDLGSLQNIYVSLPEGPAKTRIALATDAIGGGFNAQALGRDIEARLLDPTTKSQALNDVLIARALGATISDPVAEVLYDATLPRSNLAVSQFMLLDAAVEANSRAELTLLAADLLSKPNLSLSDRARIISALRRGGLQRFAGPLAAEAFLEAL